MMMMDRRSLMKVGTASKQASKRHSGCSAVVVLIYINQQMKTQQQINEVWKWNYSILMYIIYKAYNKNVIEWQH